MWGSTEERESEIVRKRRESKGKGVNLKGECGVEWSGLWKTLVNDMIFCSKKPFFDMVLFFSFGPCSMVEMIYNSCSLGCVLSEYW